MQNPYRIFKRKGGVFYIEETKTKRQESLRTRSKREAEQLLLARNQAAMQPHLNIALAPAYISGSDPAMLLRTWQTVFNEYRKRGRESSQERASRVAASAPFELIRDKPLLNTSSSDFLAVLDCGGSSTNN